MKKHTNFLTLNRVYTVTYQDVKAIAATSGDVTLFTLPKGSLVQDTLLKPKTAFKDLADAIYADGVLNSDTSLVSATAVFVAADVGKTVTGTGIPASTTIASRTNATTVVLSNPTTITGTGKTFTIVARAHGVSAVTARIITSDHNYGTAFDVFQAPGDEVFDSDIVRFREPFSSPIAVKVHLVSTGGNLSTLTSGELEVIVDFKSSGV